MKKTKNKIKNNKFVYCTLDALHQSLVFRTSCYIFYLNMRTTENSPIESIVINSNASACNPRNLLSKHSNMSVFRSLFVSTLTLSVKFFLIFLIFLISFISFRNSKRPKNNFQSICKIEEKNFFLPFSLDHVVIFMIWLEKLNAKLASLKMHKKQFQMITAKRFCGRLI